MRLALPRVEKFTCTGGSRNQKQFQSGQFNKLKNTVCSSIMKTFGTVKYLERKYCKIYAKSMKKVKKGLQ